MLLRQTKSMLKFTTALLMWEMPFTVVSVYTTLKAGFHMIATITVKKYCDRGNHSDHMETTLQFEIAPNLSI